MVGCGVKVGVAVGAGVVGAAVGEDDGVFVGIPVVLVGATVGNAGNSDDDGAAGIKVVGGFVLDGIDGPVPVSPDAVSCALTEPSAAETTVAATSHIRLRR